MNPEFQRGHVWTEKQQVAYVEYKIAGGPGADIIYFNCTGWMDDFSGPFVCVDGLQRITAIQRFVDEEIKAYNYFINEYEDKKNLLRKNNIKFKVNNLKTSKEVLSWYLEMNLQGTPHTTEELNKVRDMLKHL